MMDRFDRLLDITLDIMLDGGTHRSTIRHYARWWIALLAY